MRMPNIRTTAGVVVMSVLWLAVILSVGTDTAGAGLGDGLLPPPPTTIVDDPSAALGDFVEGATSPEDPPSSTTSTTSTTAPAEPAPTSSSGDEGGAAGGGQSATTESSGAGVVSDRSSADARKVEASAPAPQGSGTPSPTSATTGAPSAMPAAAAVDATLGRPGAGAPVAASARPSTLNAGPGSAASPIFVGRSTNNVLGMLAGLNLAPRVVARMLAPFPVAGPARYSADFGAPRHNPQPHPHQGTDVFAAAGTPVIASADGSLGYLAVDSPVAGTSLRLTAKGGTYFLYAHLDRFAPGVQAGDAVAKGDVLGFVGSTGNAEGTEPHLHYEIHPLGGAAVDPVPYLDQWLVDASVAAESVQGSPALSLRLRAGASPSASRRSQTTTSNGRRPSPVRTQLGGLETISSSAAAPAGLLVVVVGCAFAMGRVRRRVLTRTR